MVCRDFFFKFSSIVAQFYALYDLEEYLDPNDFEVNCLN